MLRLLPATEHTAWLGAHALGALQPRASGTTGAPAPSSRGPRRTLANDSAYICEYVVYGIQIVCVSFREGADAGVFDFFTKKHIKHIK